MAAPLLLVTSLPLLSGCHGGGGSASSPPVKPAATASALRPAPPPALAPLPPGGVRGIYLTGWTAGHARHMAGLLALVDRTEINAMVIDVKDDGEVSYGVDVPLVKEMGVNRKMFKVDALMTTLNAHHIFPIARIACMRDTPLAEAHPEMAVHDPNGKVWHDKTHHAWLNPYNRAVWDYNVAVALDAIKHGFKEVQFDYVRFPSEGKVSTLVYPGKPKNALREDQIVAFMKYAHEKIRAQGAWFSADVFGLTSLVKNDEGIGQRFIKVVQNVDYLCPMVYPSHYARGEYHIPNPNVAPYQILHLSLGDAKKRLKAAPNCHLRPWLQAFSLYGVHYGPAQLAAQLRAARELGIHEYLLWNAGCNYAPVEAALATEKTVPPRALAGPPKNPLETAGAADAGSSKPAKTAPSTDLQSTNPPPTDTNHTKETRKL